MQRPSGPSFPFPLHGVGPEPGPDFEIDHVFVAVGRGAPEVEVLAGCGFEEGPPNTHPGQGTACRRVFFQDAYLELIWLEDASEAGSSAVERTGLASRVACTEGASRLGIGLRPVSPRAEVPFSMWTYRPAYLPEDRWIPVSGSSRLLAEPLVFFLPWERGWTAPALPHPNGATAVTRVQLSVCTGRSLSPTLAWLREAGFVDVEVGSGELLTLRLDDGRRGESLDLAPAVPLKLEW